MKKYKPRVKTLEKIVSYLDARLHLPLSMDDALYLRWRAHNEAFDRRYSQTKERLWAEWNSKYTIRFSNGIYEKGQVVKR